MSIPQEDHHSRLNSHETKITELKMDLSRLDSNVNNISNNVDKIITSINSLRELAQPKSTNWVLFISILAFIFTSMGAVLGYTNSVTNEKIQELKLVNTQQTQQIHDNEIREYQNQIEQLKSK
jgi:peptidoglycan hydrolase CwlO-like protein